MRTPFKFNLVIGLASYPDPLSAINYCLVDVQIENLAGFVFSLSSRCQEHRLGSELIYKTIEPCAELEPFVECFWLLAAPRNDQEEPRNEIVLPDGKTELIVHFGDDFSKLEKTSWNESKFVRQARVLMSGQLTEHIVLKPSGAIG
jgi:hypothetical protein